MELSMVATGEVVPALNEAPYAILEMLDSTSIVAQLESHSSPSIIVPPIELLCRIFCYMRHFDDKKLGGVTLHARTPPWAPILHVCSSWRTIARECKSLWSILPLGHPEWTIMALRLSEPAELALCIPGFRLFTQVNESTSVDDRLLDEAFALTLPHLARVSRLQLEMHPTESARDEDGLRHQAFMRARTLLAPLSNESMDKLRVLACSGGDMTGGYLLGGDCIQNIRSLTLTFCRFPKQVDLLALPLVRLNIFMPDFHSSVVDFLTVIDSCKTLKQLAIGNPVNPRRYDELFGSETTVSESRLPRVGLPLLKSLTFVSSPLLMSAYLPQFDIPSTTIVTSFWWAADYQVPGAALPDIMNFAIWPMVEKLGFNPTNDQRLAWLSQLCIAFIQHIHLSTTDTNYKHFTPSIFSYHPRAYEHEKRTAITMNFNIAWHPDDSVIGALAGVGTQSLYRSMFSVNSNISEVSEWSSIFDIMRRRGECGASGPYTTPAVFTSMSTVDEAQGLVKVVQPSLTLIALDRIDLTTPYAKSYFPVAKHILRQSFPKNRAPFSVNVLFPFGLKLDNEQREDVREFNVRTSGYLNTTQITRITSSIERFYSI